ncbi:hypothetical protein CBEVV_014 [Choristoneura biennis entomopoxvirus 'L' virophage]|nr:hypothetical protein CBEVV_014 [Choristoneura biennis entomopoxvirus 'L' virophage]
MTKNKKKNTYIEIFYSSIRQLGLPDDNLEDLGKIWEYIGGDKKSTKRLMFKDFTESKIDYPEHKSYCICGHYIKEQCWVRHVISKKIITVGNCCVKKFLNQNTNLKCTICKSEHKNKKDNLCNNCRLKNSNKTKCKFCDGNHRNKKDNICGKCLKKLCSCKNNLIYKYDNKCKNCLDEYIKNTTCETCLCRYYGDKCDYCFTNPDDNSIIKFGKNIYQTFGYVRLNDKKYCLQVINNIIDYKNSNTKLFIKYIQNNIEDFDDFIVDFGKYKNQNITFKDVYNKNKEYCKFLVDKNINNIFVTYIKLKNN